jgi:hypothetical protein
LSGILSPPGSSCDSPGRIDLRFKAGAVKISGLRWSSDRQRRPALPINMAPLIHPDSCQCKFLLCIAREIFLIIQALWLDRFDAKLIYFGHSVSSKANYTPVRRAGRPYKVSSRSNFVGFLPGQKAVGRSDAFPIPGGFIGPASEAPSRACG